MVEIFSPSVLNTPLRQGEILSQVIQLIPGNPGEIPSGAPPAISAEIITHKYSVIVSQDCDLNSDFYNREEMEANVEKKGKLEPKLLSNVLLCEASMWSSLSAIGIDSKDRLKKNQDIKYHYLQNVSEKQDLKGVGIDALVISFHRSFSVSTKDLLERIKTAQTDRRAIMNSPYFEHLSDRFTYYVGRVGLPADHN